MDGGEPMILGSIATGVSALVSLAVVVGPLLYFATVGIGVVSAVVHDRDPPESLRDRAFWLSRGIAYLTLAAFGTLGAVWGLVAEPASTIIVLAIFFLGLVAWRMRGRVIG